MVSQLNMRTRVASKRGCNAVSGKTRRSSSETIDVVEGKHTLYKGGQRR